MSMTKKDFVALADRIRKHNNERHEGDTNSPPFNPSQINLLADFCQQQNPDFNKKRRLNYVADKCGPNGGKK
jgi:hypothetical protein